MLIRNIRYAAHLENGTISCDVLLEGMNTYLPYTASATDGTKTGTAVWQALMSGAYDVTPFRVTPERLAVAVQDKKAEISAWRDEQESAAFTFEYNNRQWDGGRAPQERLSAAVTAATLKCLPDNFFWTDADNNDVTMTASDLKQLSAAMSATTITRGFEIHRRQRQMKEEVDALTTLESIRAYAVGWPEGTDSTAHE